ncbi:MAG TPA: hypothetical protein VFO25_05785 [Candidatus Eremiobacteraceae bacterium]|nr:hypothetical protein [Candidatus Eremiobacteraceae bacterium]
MLSALLASAVFGFAAFGLNDPVASPLPATASQASPAPVATQRPLREVVYDVTTNWRIDDITESYAGGADATDPGSTEYKNGQGTVTVDVFGQTADGSLIVTVTEAWKEPTKQLPLEATIQPSGNLNFDLTGPTSLDNVGGELLPYFGTQFAPAGTLDTTTRWSIEGAAGKISTRTDYQITAVSGDTVTVHKDQTIKEIETITVDGSVVYEPSLLVPISGTVRKRSTEMYSDGQTTRTLVITFTRTSDTFASKAH